MDTQSSSELGNKLLLALSTGANIQQLLDIGAEYFQNPVYLVGHSLRLVGYAQWKKEVRSWNWHELLTKGYFDYDWYIMHKKAREFREDNLNREVMVMPTDERNDKHLVYNVHMENTYMGAVNLVENDREVTEADKEDIKILGSALGICLKTDRRQYNYREKMRDTLYRTLLSGEPISEEELQERRRYLNLTFKRFFYVFTAVLPLKDRTVAIYSFYNRFFSTALPEAYPLVYDDDIVVIYNTDDICDDKTYFHELADFAKENNMRLAVSNVLWEVRDIHVGLEQNRELLHIGGLLDGGHYLPYSRYALNHVAGALGQMPNGIDFCHPDVRILYEYDRANQTEYIKTLYTFFHTNMNHKETSQQLHIHRNTLAYRMEKIASMTSIDWSDGGATGHLFLSLKILLSMGKVQL